MEEDRVRTQASTAAAAARVEREACEAAAAARAKPPPCTTPARRNLSKEAHLPAPERGEAKVFMPNQVPNAPKPSHQVVR